MQGNSIFFGAKRQNPLFFSSLALPTSFADPSGQKVPISVLAWKITYSHLSIVILNLFSKIRLEKTSNSFQDVRLQWGQSETDRSTLPDQLLQGDFAVLASRQSAPSCAGAVGTSGSVRTCRRRWVVVIDSLQLLFNFWIDFHIDYNRFCNGFDIFMPLGG